MVRRPSDNTVRAQRGLVDPGPVGQRGRGDDLPDRSGVRRRPRELGSVLSRVQEQLAPPDLLAAVVLHTLVAEGRDGMTTADVARACERNPRDPADAREVDAAIEILVEDGLAERTTAHADREALIGEANLVRPTLAAVMGSSGS